MNCLAEFDGTPREACDGVPEQTNKIYRDLFIGYAASRRFGRAEYVQHHHCRQ